MDIDSRHHEAATTTQFHVERFQVDSVDSSSPGSYAISCVRSQLIAVPATV